MATELDWSRRLLEDSLGRPVRTVAYPHGYSNAATRTVAQELGHAGACAVRNGLSPAHDDPFRLARLMVRDSTSPQQVGRWLRGLDAPVPSSRESFASRGFRVYRRARHSAEGRA